MTFFCKRFDDLSPSEVYEILKARCEVFLLEQRIICQDMDDVDYDALHFFIKEGKTVLACLRLHELKDDATAVKIGRVLTRDHRKGMGRALLEYALDTVKRTGERRRVVVHAQTQAEGFYEKCGFHTVSDVYMEDGIPHVTMEQILDK